MVWRNGGVDERLDIVSFLQGILLLRIVVSFIPRQHFRHMLVHGTSLLRWFLETAKSYAQKTGSWYFQDLEGIKKEKNNTGARMTSSTSDNPQENEKKNHQLC